MNNPPQISLQQIYEQKLALEKSARSGASWFYWIGGLSILNSIVSLFGGTLTFFFGLAITQVIDLLARTIERNLGATRPGILSLLAFGFDLLAAGIFVLIGFFAIRRNKPVYLVGMLLYGLDGLVFLGLGYWLGVGVHLFALLFLWLGFRATRKVAAVEAGAAPLESLYPETALAERARLNAQNRPGINWKRVGLLIGAILLICLVAGLILWALGEL